MSLFHNRCDIHLNTYSPTFGPLLMYLHGAWKAEAVSWRGSEEVRERVLRERICGKERLLEERGGDGEEQWLNPDLGREALG